MLPLTQTISERKTLWEVPASPKGVLLLCYGCNHQGSDFWPASDRCQDCLGLPGEVTLRTAAIKHGYAVIAVTSIDRSSKCWSGEDLKVGVCGNPIQGRVAGRWG